ncbi:MAG TPA: YbaB/EbfC family nucleoid-associated protein [Planctomycetaceae bacterium]|nr:YbaB/EbfC family nucleoid-associated protein [Planctomycetaceae bacterium]|tara:strand:+ start:458 stop:808 length:351 start_codon:yes stop_codon:yes gene_type:complete
MFDQLKNLGNMMAQAQKMQSRMTEAKEKIAELRVEGSAGGEMVRVEATGDMKILGVHIEETLLDAQDSEMLEELITAATNQAIQKAKEAAAEAMSEVAGGMDIPGLSDALGKMGLG